MREKMVLKKDTMVDGKRIRVFQSGETEVIVEGELNIRAYAESVIHLVDTYLDPSTTDFHEKHREHDS